MATRHIPALPPTTVSAGFSRGLILILFVLHLLPLLACLGSGVPPWARIAVAMGVVVSSVANFRRARGLSGVSLRLLSQGQLLILRDGREIEAERAPGTADLPVMLMVAWREGDGTRGRCVLMRDGMSAETWRQARIWVRWSQPVEVASEI